VGVDQIIHPEVRTFFLVMVAGCAYALWRGRLPERVTAVAMLLAWVSTQIMNTHNWAEPQYTIFVVDLIFLVILAGLALLSGRRWLMAAAAFHVLTVADHIATILDVQIRSYAYLTALVIWGYAVIAAMVIGTLLEAEPERRRLAALSGSPVTSE
jgi:hypothetical protein